MNTIHVLVNPIRLQRLLRYLFVTILVVSNLGCSSSGDSEQTSTADVSAPINTPSKPQPQTHIVEIKQMKFVPDVTEARIGDKITFVNMDIFSHDITEETDKKWNSSIMLSGTSWSMTVEENASYYCSLHVIMKGKIKIKE